MKSQYLQFYDNSIQNPSFHMLVEMCGNGSILELDGRLSLGSCIGKGIEHCRKNGIKGFRVCKKSPSGNWGHMLTDMYRVTSTTVTN